MVVIIGVFKTHRISSDMGVEGDTPNAAGMVGGNLMIAALPSFSKEASAGSVGGYRYAMST